MVPPYTFCLRKNKMAFNAICKACDSRPERMPFMLRSFLVRDNQAVMDEVHLCSYRCIIQYSLKMMIFKSKEVFTKISLTGMPKKKKG
jgi:hypothetical protein